MRRPGLLLCLLLLSACATTPPAGTRPGGQDKTPVAAARKPATAGAAEAKRPAAPAAPVAPDPELLSLSSELGAALAGRDFELTVTPAGLLLRLPSHTVFEPEAIQTSPAANELLARIAGVLAPHDRLSAEVSVHTDVIGGALANDSLARQRAEAVVTRLVAAGIDSPRLQVGAGGTRDPLAANDTAEGRRRNRRVEILMRLAAVPAAS